MDSHKIENEKKQEIQVYLELALSRKVTITNIFNINSDRNESYKDQISYKVWLYSSEIIRDASTTSRNNDSNKGKYGNNPKIFTFKLGPIQIDELKNGNQGLNQPDFYSAVLARVFVGKSQSYYVDDIPANLNDIKFPPNDNYECYYLHQKQKDSSNIKIKKIKITT